MARKILICAIILIVGVTITCDAVYNSDFFKVKRAKEYALNADYWAALDEIRGVDTKKRDSDYALQQYIELMITRYNIDEVEQRLSEIKKYKSELDIEFYTTIKAIEVALATYYETLDLIEEIRDKVNFADETVSSMEAIGDGEWFKIREVRTDVEKWKEALDEAAVAYDNFTDYIEASPNKNEVVYEDVRSAFYDFNRSINNAFEFILEDMQEVEDEGYGIDSELQYRSEGASRISFLRWSSEKDVAESSARRIRIRLVFWRETAQKELLAKISAL